MTSLPPDEAQLVDRYYDAMRAGPDGEAALLELFADDAVYIEPFGGAPAEHRGKAAIMAAFQRGWEAPPPDLELVVRRVDKDGDRVRSEWTCTSPAFPGPMNGVDVYTIAEGKIVRLEVTLASPPAG